MAKAKKPKYEYVGRDAKFRKRVKNELGKYVAIYGDTPADVTEQLIDFCEQRDINAEEMKNPLVTVYTLRWLDLQSGNISPQTKSDYQRVIRNQINPVMEGLHMSDVRPNDIKAVISGVGQKSESLHNKTYMLLKRIFTTAYEDGIIPTNPCPIMHNGGVAAKAKTALTDEQITILLDALKGTRAYLFCMIALYAGLRKEEILALKWDSIYLDDVPRIDVCRALRHERNHPIVSYTLKSDAAKRTIPIPEVLVTALREEKCKSTSDFLFYNQSGEPLSDTQFRNLWHAVIARSTEERSYYKYKDGKKIQFTVKPQKDKKANCRQYYYTIDFKVTPHQLRHTYITNLLLAGTDIKTVQYLAGHEKSKTTLDIYAHLTYNKPEHIIGKVRAAFSQP